jgi:hypothetical protein
MLAEVEMFELGRERPRFDPAGSASAGAELHIIHTKHQVTDLPMYRHMKGVPFKDGKTMDQRARGYGGLHSCCSENSVLDLASARH